MKRILTITLVTGLLLYKVVNWWYTCLEQDTQWLCGQSLRFESHGEIRVSGNSQGRKMDLILPKECADQLSVFTKPNG